MYSSMNSRMRQSYYRRLHERGFAIALDDFGSGYSSLRYLHELPIDVVKN